MRRLIAGILTLLLAGCGQPLEQVDLPAPIFDAATAERLATTTVTNMDAVLARKALLAAPGSSEWLTVDPYRPALGMGWSACSADTNCRYNLLATGLPRREFPASSPVYDWWQSRQLAVDSAEVCGVQFADDARTTYALQTFDDLASLQATPGAILTHYQACGACSTLQDLAIYGTRDLTVMAKTCSKRFGLADKKACMLEIGFSEPCAEAWAYNAQQTAARCALVCVNTYGLQALLEGREDVPPVDAEGNLNPCLLCDEMLSGPGFQYSAGRIRRNSGILSEIERPDEQVYPVNHDYF